jgi:hypothetical protein
MASEASPDFLIKSMFSMIAELANNISSQDGNIGEITYQRTLLPAPAIMGESHQLLKTRTSCETNVFRKPIEGNLVWTISIPRKCRLRQTMLLSRCVAIHGQDCDSSMDRVERANFERPAVACHLPDSISDFGQQW